MTTIGIARDDGAGHLSWHLRYSNSAGGSNARFLFGNADTDYPVVGDWNHDYKETIGFARIGDPEDETPRPITWYLRNSNSAGPSDTHFNFGRWPADIPVVGDWNGDGTDSIGIVRIDDQGRYVWYLKYFNSAGGSNTHFVFGRVLDFPVVGDWDGDGDDNVGIVRSDGSGHEVWYLRYANAAGGSNVHFEFGNPDTDYPVVGDWNHDGKDTIGFARLRDSGPIDWHLRNSNSAGGSNSIFNYGTNPALAPVTGAWVGANT